MSCKQKDDQLGDVVNLEEHAARQRLLRKEVRAAAHRLDSISTELFDLALQLALAGPLHEWNESQPIGAFADLDAVLAAVQDGRVVALLRLRETVFDTAAILKSPVP